jgi:CubicO group peptidase (beta-lactamase class C family)
MQMCTRSWATPMVLLALTLSLVAAAVAQGEARPSSHFSAIDAYIQAQMEKHGLPGVAVVITQGDQIVHARAFGTAGAGRNLTPQTPMYIGSTSKSFTALAVAQLAEQGKIDLDAPVRTYIPWFRVADEAASQKLTVRHFLHHASGLSESGFSVVVPDDATLEEAVRSLEHAQLTAPVGAKSQYFNHNFDVLALLVQQVRGQPFDAYIAKHIFTPLQMKHSYTDPAVARANGWAQGYSRFFGWVVPAPQPHPAYALGEGYLIVSPEDLAHYVIANNNAGQYGDARILSPAWMTRLHTPRPQEGFRYAMGWYVDSVKGVPRIQHGGANETFKTFMATYPTKQLGLVVMINQGYLVDHYISADQLFGGVEMLALEQGQPNLAAGYAVPMLGRALLAIVLVLAAFQGWQLWQLRSWRWRARVMNRRRRAVDIGLNFAIPTMITSVVIWQVAGFFGDQFNLVQQTAMLFRWLPDIGMLIVVGTVPDYLQGIVKLVWLLRGLPSAGQNNVGPKAIAFAQMGRHKNLARSREQDAWRCVCRTIR